MITEAVAALKEKSGSSLTSIAKYIEVRRAASVLSNWHRHQHRNSRISLTQITFFLGLVACVTSSPAFANFQNCFCDCFEARALGVGDPRILRSLYQFV